MPLSTHIDLLRLDGTDHYYLWQSDLEAGSFDTPIVQDGPAPVTFATEAAARQYARPRFIEVHFQRADVIDAVHILQ